MKDSSIAHVNDLMTRYPVLAEWRGEVGRMCEAILSSYRAGGKLLACGNGGSGADCEHLVGELMKGFLMHRPVTGKEAARLSESAGADGPTLVKNLQRAVPAISLVSQTALTTAVANDLQGEMIFAQQVYGYGTNRDVLVVFSSSGNSRNVVLALRVARFVGLQTVGLTGSKGGAMNSLCDILIRVPADTAYRVQELHLPIYHTVCIVVENELFGPD